MRRVVIAIMALVLGSEGTSFAQATVLDLTTPMELTVSGEPNGPGRGSVRMAGSGSPRPSVELSLTSINPSACAWDGHVIYEAAIRNIGSVPLVVPWSALPSEARRPDGTPREGYQTLTLLLEVEDRSADGEFILLDNVSTAYGSTDSAATLKTVAPKESVRVRGLARCRTLNAGESQRLRQMLPGSFQVRLTAFVRRPSGTSVMLGRSRPSELYLRDQ